MNTSADEIKVTDSPFYRVAVKALVRDANDRILIVQNLDGRWELPGGGWDHDESYQDCIRREIYEELCVNVSRVGAIAFVYRGRSQSRGFSTLRLVVPVTLADTDFIVGDDARDVRYISRDEFDTVDFSSNEAELGACVDTIWATSVYS